MKPLTRLCLLVPFVAWGFAVELTYELNVVDFSAHLHEAKNVRLVPGGLLFGVGKGSPNAGPNKIGVGFDGSLPEFARSRLALFSDEGFWGGAAEFKSTQNTIELRPSKHPFFAGGDLGRFSVEVYVLFDSLRGTPVLLERRGSFIDVGGKLQHQRFSLMASNRRLVLLCENVFRFGNKSIDLRLKGTTSLETQRWYRVGVGFDSLTARLTALLDGEVEASAFATDDLRPTSSPYYALFLLGEDVPLVLGRGLLGKIDELRIDARLGNLTPSEEGLVGGEARPKEASFTSRVLELKPKSKLRRIHIELANRNDEAKRTKTSPMRLYYRSSSRLFEEELPESRLPWRQVPLGRRIKEGVAHGFAQFKVVVGADLPGAPLLASMQLGYAVGRGRLPTPTWRRYKVGGEAITLVWDFSPNPKIRGYRVVYKNTQSKVERRDFLPIKATMPSANEVRGLPRLFRHQIQPLKANVIYEVFVVALGEGELQSNPSKTLRLRTDPFAEEGFTTVEEEQAEP